MPQGARGWWVRAARMSLSAVLCAGAIGCMSTDKPPPPKIGANTKQVTPPPGLPGLQPLPGTTTGPGPVGNNTRPNTFNPSGTSGVQPAGFATTNPGAGLGSQPPRTIGQPVTPNSQVVPAVGFQPQPSPFVPNAGPGAVVPAGGPAMPQPNFGPGNGASFNPQPTELTPLPPLPPGNGATSNYSPVASPVPPLPVAPAAPTNPAVYGEVSGGVYRMSK